LKPIQREHVFDEECQKPREQQQRSHPQAVAEQIVGFAA
jgi:hypothetical protein